MFGYWQISFAVFIVLQSCCGLRRIIQGRITPNERRFMVYLVKSREANVKYDAWLCGGVIVHPSFIITSAACIEDVQFIYAIAGYNKYRNSEEIYNDPCTQAKKKKLVMTCVPQLYDFEYHKLTKWANLDIAVAQVESPYDYFDNTYLENGCSYPPSQIGINFEPKYSMVGTDAFVLGWGHTARYRSEEDTKDYNEENLRDAPVKIVKKGECKDKMPTDFHSIIDKYMLCTYGSGDLSSDGRVLKSDVKLKEQCDCEGDDCVCGNNNSDIRLIDGKSPGFCQNDHGGPLLGWVGGNLKLLGVQSVFVIDKDKNCVGPFMYTSTDCSSTFLDCVINKGKTLQLDCQDRKSLGFDMVKRRISWEGHPDGPSASEILEKRPQLYSDLFHDTLAIRPQVPLN